MGSHKKNNNNNSSAIRRKGGLGKGRVFQSSQRPESKKPCKIMFGNSVPILILCFMPSFLEIAEF